MNGDLNADVSGDVAVAPRSEVALAPINAMAPNPPADHILGPVQDDWEAAEVW